MGTILDRKNISEIIKLKNENKKIVFTNGCFDILHIGHIDYLKKAKQLGDILVIGINSDDSVKKNKGEKRPIVPEFERATIISSFFFVDYVVLFSEETPLNLITEIIPNILVKGADWEIEKIVGKEIVEKNGGKVIAIDLVPNRSTTNAIEKIISIYK